MPSTADSRRLFAIKLVHTLVWAVFVGCIVAMPVLAWQGSVGVASILSAVVLAEVLVLAANGWSCPLTKLAANYTDERRDNFDIFLPLWLARHNKTIFGTLYFAGLISLLVAWSR